jgi:hypothetical protein
MFGLSCPPHPRPAPPRPARPPPTHVAPNGDDVTETQSPLSSSLTPSLPHRHNTHALCRKESQLTEQIVDYNHNTQTSASAHPIPVQLVGAMASGAPFDYGSSTQYPASYAAYTSTVEGMYGGGESSAAREVSKRACE